MPWGFEDDQSEMKTDKELTCQQEDKQVSDIGIALISESPGVFREYSSST